MEGKTPIKLLIKNDCDDSINIHIYRIVIGFVELGTGEYESGSVADARLRTDRKVLDSSRT